MASPSRNNSFSDDGETGQPTERSLAAALSRAAEEDDTLAATDAPRDDDADPRDADPRDQDLTTVDLTGLPPRRVAAVPRASRPRAAEALGTAPSQRLSLRAAPSFNSLSDDSDASDDRPNCGFFFAPVDPLDAAACSSWGDEGADGRNVVTPDALSSEDPRTPAAQIRIVTPAETLVCGRNHLAQPALFDTVLEALWGRRAADGDELGVAGCLGAPSTAAEYAIDAAPVEVSTPNLQEPDLQEPATPTSLASASPPAKRLGRGDAAAYRVVRRPKHTD